MCDFEGYWKGIDYVFEKNTLNNIVTKNKYTVEIKIKKQSNYIFEIEVLSDFAPGYIDKFLGFYNSNAKTIQAIHHNPTYKVDGLSNFYIRKNKLYNGFNFIKNNTITTGNIKLKKVT